MTERLLRLMLHVCMWLHDRSARGIRFSAHRLRKIRNQDHYDASFAAIVREM